MPGGGRGPVAELRAGALTRFAERACRPARLEDWKFTGLDALTRTAFAPGKPEAVAVDRAFLDSLAPVADAARLVFVDGAFRADCRMQTASRA